jgi:hypothetical protein
LIALPVNMRKPRSVSTRIVGFALLALCFCLALFVIDNNVSFPKTSKADFHRDLDRTLASSTNWTLAQYTTHEPSAAGGSAATGSREGTELASNAALVYMVEDCASMSDDVRLKQLSARLAEAWRVQPSIFGGLVDPALAEPTPNSREIAAIPEYERWILHGALPNTVPLQPNDLADMFSPNRYRTGAATHQLLALYLYRKSKGSSADLERVMNQVEERIASEAALDFRVTDLYLQRIAFLLAAGRADLVRRRWVERAVTAQQNDGGWLKDWHGWNPTVYKFSFRDEQSSAHATAQGMWMACMLKHRYPDWIDKNYR